MSDQAQAIAFSYGSFTWWTGVVEERISDPKQLGRVKVRIIGYHTDSLADLPVDDLFYATVIQPITSAAMNGIGTTPLGIVEGTHVIGFFMDGDDNQIPVIFGTIGGFESGNNSTSGFRDPNGKYPLRTGEPDTNRLAIGKDHPIMQRGGDNASTALGGNFTEPKTQYAAKYPYNHVRETESGHVEEWDDTEGAERYLRYHKSGTFHEIYPDGMSVEHTVGDMYNITKGNGYVHIGGDGFITIDGNAKFLVGGNYDVEVKGNKTERIHGNYTLVVGNKWDVTTGSTTDITAGGKMTLKAPRIDLN